MKVVRDEECIGHNDDTKRDDYVMMTYVILYDILYIIYIYNLL